MSSWRIIEKENEKSVCPAKAAATLWLKLRVGESNRWAA
jgi:hypothetical protein